jgi:hypothetical protein
MIRGAGDAALDTVMPEIELHFTDTFKGETAIVSLDNDEVLRAEGLKTDFRTGLARRVMVNSDKDPVSLAIEVMPGAGKQAADIDAAQTKFVVVSLQKGNLRLKPISREEFAREPRGYA